MSDDLLLLSEVKALSPDDLRAYALARAKHIVRQTPGEPEDAAWDDPEEWLTDATQLAHAVVQLVRTGQLKP